MAKGKRKKTNKKSSRSSKGSNDHAGTITPSSVERSIRGEQQQQHIIWSIDDECAHYAALGCHIANIARCRQPISSSTLQKSKLSSARHPKSDKCTTSSSSYTCSEFGEMHQIAMRRYPWLLGMERFDPSDYHPDDIEHIPEVAMNDGEDDDDRMTLTLTNVTKDTTNICFVTVYDVDVCDADGNILKSGVTTSSTTYYDRAPNNATRENCGKELGKLEHSPTSTASTSSTKAIIRNERKCTTFIILCPPQTFVHLCSLSPDQHEISSPENNTIIPIRSWSQIKIESDVQPWSSHPNAEDEHPHLLHFPFHDGSISCCTSAEEEEEEGCENDNTNRTTTLSTDTAAYQCTQSENGQLTHFFHGNHHAIDFACPVGTQLYSPVNGIVVDVHYDNISSPSSSGELSGIAATNLFHWNSIMIRVDEGLETVVGMTDSNAAAKDEESEHDPLYVEFVHIQSNSCTVEVGDAVTRGQTLCRSGSVGFSPEPHLHLAAYRSNGDDAATVRVRFECCSLPSRNSGDGNGSGGELREEEKSASFLPITGGWYNRSGLVSKHR